MSKSHISGFTYESPNRFLGFEDGKFYVEPFEAIPYADRETLFARVYDRTLEQIQQDIIEGRQRYPRIIPAEGKNKAAFGYLKVKNLMGLLVPSPIALAVGTHEKVGRIGKRSNVANLNSVVVRALGDDASCLEGKRRILRGSGVAKGVANVLLNQFDPDLHVTVMNVPETLRPIEIEAMEKVLVGGYGFAKRTSGKISRDHGNNDQPWYEGPTVQEIQNQLAASSDMIRNGLERTVELPVPIELGSMAAVGGVGSSRPLIPFR